MSQPQEMRQLLYGKEAFEKVWLASADFEAKLKSEIAWCGTQQASYETPTSTGHVAERCPTD